MAAALNAAQVIRRVRQRMGLSQGALARLLNTSNTAIQHWERGHNRPGLARLLALQQFCPHGRERTRLDALIGQTQARVLPLGVGTGDRRRTGSSEDSRPARCFHRFPQ